MNLTRAVCPRKTGVVLGRSEDGGWGWSDLVMWGCCCFEFEAVPGGPGCWLGSRVATGGLLGTKGMVDGGVQSRVNPKTVTKY